MLMLVVVLLLSLSQFKSHASVSAECTNWFSAANIKVAGERCVIECASLKVSMKTFYCTESCDDLCKVAKVVPYHLNQLTTLIGLSTSEVAVFAQNPTKAKKAYDLGRTADASVEKILGRNYPNDESDAARHFIWAGLLVNEFDRKFAEKILEAHEADAPTSDPERAMDTHNNREAIKVATVLKKRKSLTIKNLEDEALKAIKDKRLIVISPRGDVK